MKGLRIITLLIAVCMAAGAQAQTVAHLEADTIALGDQTTLVVQRAEEYPSTEWLGRDGIVALSQRFDTADGSQHTVLTCFEPGEHYVHIGPDDSLLLVVTDVEVDTTTAEIRDIAAIERMPYTFWELFRWVLLALGIAVVVAAVVLLVTHRERIGQVLGTAAPVDTRTPEERALQGLEELRRKQLWQAGKAKEYHTELTDLVRRFIEESTGIRATDMTSDETLDALREAPCRVDTAPLRDIFGTADMVKFAKSEPLPYEHDRSLAEAVVFVKAMWAAVRPADEQADKEAAEQHE